MFNQLERNLRNKGQKELADAVKALRQLNGSDIPLPGKEGANLIRFSPEQRKGLERNGYLVYSLTGQTIATLRDAGHPFATTWHQGDSIEQVRSMLTEVAVNRRSLFLQDSNHKTLDERLKMVKKFGRQIAGEVKGVTAVLGSAPDYAELAFAHFEQTGQRLFGKDFGGDYACTTTPTAESYVLTVGGFGANGLRVTDWPRNPDFDFIWAAPLVVPAAAAGR